MLVYRDRNVVRILYTNAWTPPEAWDAFAKKMTSPPWQQEGNHVVLAIVPDVSLPAGRLGA